MPALIRVPSLLASTLALGLASAACSAPPGDDEGRGENASEPESDHADRFGEIAYRSPGCFGSPARPAGSTSFNWSLSAGPNPRQYRVTIPPGYQPNLPHALFVWGHACGSSHFSLSSATANALASRGYRTISVAPNSAWADLTGNADARGPDGQKCWNLNTQWYDVGFVDALVDHMMENYCIDTRNVFFYGKSSGGFAAQGIGCHIGATAIVAERSGIHHPNPQFPNFPQTPPPAAGACGPIPALIGFSRHDTAVPYNLFAPVARNFWIANNNCATTSTRNFTAESYVCGSHLSNCACRSFNGCAAPFVMCEWDGGHSVNAISPAAAAWWFSRFAE